MPTKAEVELDYLLFLRLFYYTIKREKRKAITCKQLFQKYEVLLQYTYAKVGIGLLDTEYLDYTIDIGKSISYQQGRKNIRRRSI